MAHGLRTYTCRGALSARVNPDIKQLLDEVEHDIMNYQNLVSVLSAEAEGRGR